MLLVMPVTRGGGRHNAVNNVLTGDSFSYDGDHASGDPITQEAFRQLRFRLIRLLSNQPQCSHLKSTHLKKEIG